MTDILTVILLVSGLVLRIAHAQPCLGFSYSRHQNKRLGYGIFKTLECSPIECQKDCARTLSCFSVNTYRNDKGAMTCELVKETKESAGWSVLVHKNGGEHNEIKTITSCEDKSIQCKITKKGILPGHWYVQDSSAFKLFKAFKTHSEAGKVCAANGGELVIINNENDNEFLSKVLLPKITIDPAPEIQSLRPLKHWKLDGSDTDVVSHGKAVFKKGINDSFTALYLPGSTGSYATTPALAITKTSMTMALWLKLDSAPVGQYYIYSYWGNPHMFTFFVYKAGDTTTFRVEGKSNGEEGGVSFFCGGGSVVPNVWTHVGFVLNKGLSKAFFYQDGVQVSWGTSSNNPLPSPVRTVFDIGLKRDTNQVMTGWIRDLMVFDREMSTEDMRRIRAATSLNLNVWIGASKTYSNFASDPQPSTSCVSMRGWGKYQWEKSQCNQMMEFICAKPV